MGLFDTDGFGDGTELAPIKLKQEKVFEAEEFEATLVDNIPYKVQKDVINSHYNLGKLLNDMGISTTGANMYCPFHPDEMTGHPSAKYHQDSDRLYCFSENKVYSAFDAIKLLYGIDTKKVFKDLWGNLSIAQRKEFLDRNDATKNLQQTQSTSEWDKYRDLVLDKFRTHEVSYRQYKNALFKVFEILSQKELKI